MVDELESHTDLMDDKVETESNASADSVELIKKNKRKRIEEDAENSPKRRSEEPLVKLKVVPERSLEPCSELNEEAKNEKRNKEKQIDKDSTENDDEKENGDKEDSEEEDFEVENIVDYTYDKKTEEGLYLVKWRGWGDEENTWEPEDNLECREALVKFYNQRVEQRAQSTGVEKRLLPLPPDPRDKDDLRELFLTKHYSKPDQATLEKLYQLKKKNKTPKLWPEKQLRNEMVAVAGSAKVKDKILSGIVTQLNLRELNKYRDKQIGDLKSWEVRINDVEKEASEYHVSVINDVDLEGPPTLMEYINTYKAGEGIDIPSDPPLGCECKVCTYNSECCNRVAGFEPAYSSHGKLRVDVGHPIYECNKRCECPPTCKNRVVQKGRTTKLAIYRTDNGCGWGVKAMERIKAGSFVVQYVGEVITSDEAESRGKKYDADGRTYLFDLDFNLGDDNLYTVDAAFYGNLSHFINHSCDPNLSIFNVYINCLDPNLPQLCLFARRDILKGEQLTFDYCQSTQREDEEGDESPASNQTPGKNKADKLAAAVNGGGGNSLAAAGHKTQCRCGAKNCRKVLF